MAEVRKEPEEAAHPRFRFCNSCGGLHGRIEHPDGSYDPEAWTASVAAKYAFISLSINRIPPGQLCVDFSKEFMKCLARLRNNSRPDLLDLNAIADWNERLLRRGFKAPHPPPCFLAQTAADETKEPSLRAVP